MPKAKSKLFRNLKAGDKFLIETGYGIDPYRCATITVTTVRETCRAFFTGKRQWVVHGIGWPFWWSSRCVTAYSDDRVELIP